MVWSIGEKKSETKRTAPNKVVQMRSLGRAASGNAAGQGKPIDAPAGEKDLASGMEMLEPDFLLSVVENTRGDDKNDVTMRKLTFNELLRREQLGTVDSNALKVYAVNKGNLYGRDIQCEAMKKLAGRTVRKSKPGR